MPSETKVVPLSRDSHVAMHRQLAQRLREAIASGTYEDGARLPTEPQLICSLGLAPITP